MNKEQYYDLMIESVNLLASFHEACKTALETPSPQNQDSMMRLYGAYKKIGWKMKRNALGLEVD